MYILTKASTYKFSLGIEFAAKHCFYSVSCPLGSRYCFYRKSMGPLVSLSYLNFLHITTYPLHIYTASKLKFKSFSMLIVHLLLNKNYICTSHFFTFIKHIILSISLSHIINLLHLLSHFFFLFFLGVYTPNRVCTTFSIFKFRNYIREIAWAI